MRLTRSPRSSNLPRGGNQSSSRAGVFYHGLKRVVSWTLDTAWKAILHCPIADRCWVTEAVGSRKHDGISSGVRMLELVVGACEALRATQDSRPSEKRRKPGARSGRECGEPPCRQLPQSRPVG